MKSLLKDDVILLLAGLTLSEFFLNLLTPLNLREILIVIILENFALCTLAFQLDHRIGWISLALLTCRLFFINADPVASALVSFLIVWYARTRKIGRRAHELVAACLAIMLSNTALSGLLAAVMIGLALWRGERGTPPPLW